MKSLYDSAISGAITILNDQIDDLETAKEEAVEALENARDAEIKPLEEKVKALEKEKEEMQKINEQRERELNLQKAQYDLERAQSQRNKLIYKNGQMSYVNDNSEVRSTKENLESAIFDKKVGELDDQIDALNNQIDEINEKYDKLIEQTEKFYDDQIKGLQKMVKEWEKVQHAAEMAEAIAALEELGISVEDVLSGNTEVISRVSGEYASVLAGLTNNIGSVAQAFGTDVETLTRQLSDFLGYPFDTTNISGLAENMDSVAESAEKANNAITGGGGGGTTTQTSETVTDGTSTGGAGGDTGNSGGSGLVKGIEDIANKKEDIQDISKAFGTEEGGLANSISVAQGLLGTGEDTIEAPTLIGGIQAFEDKTKSALENVKSFFEGLQDMINNLIETIDNLIDKMLELEALGGGEESDGSNPTPHPTPAPSPGGFSGSAYAHGKWNAGSKGIDGNSLVGELGQELVVHNNGTFETIGNNGAEFTKIKSSDIVFNHKQTEGLLKNGRINSRGKAYAGGKLPDNLSPVSSYSKLGSIDNLADKLEVGNQRLAAIDTNVASIVNTKTINNNPIINVNNPQFTCTGINGEEVLRQIEQSFSGLFTNAYQRSMTN